jgi:hypothetical protein
VRLWTARSHGAALVVLVLAAVAAIQLATPHAGASPRVVVEVDVAGERLVDARAVRRLISLELADVQVPPERDGDSPALFYRVLGDARGFVELELWERGTPLGSRRVSSGSRGGHLFARRIALAAAELARSQRQQRHAKKRLEARRLARERALLAELRSRTLDGPLALRSELVGGRGRNFTWFGSGAALEIELRGSTRLDLGLRVLGADFDKTSVRLSLVELSLGPSQRFRLSPWLDLDAGASLGAAVVHAAGVASVDDIAGQAESWTARAALAARFEPRVSRSVRADIGLELGHFLREMPATRDGTRLSLRGAYAGVALGVVITPAP